MSHLNKILVTFTLVVSFVSALAQQSGNYSFINYQANHLHYDTLSPAMLHFFDKWQQVTATGQGDLNIVHIGGSHVQAGTLTNRIRTNILSWYPSLVGNRGMIFPYSAAAKCNNPADYKVHCVEKVALTRNVYKQPEHDMGLCGIAVTAADTITTIQIALNEPNFDYSTQRVTIFGESPENVVPFLRLDDRDAYPSYVDPGTHRYVFNLVRPTDSFDIVLPCDTGQTFTLTGIHLANKAHGISYHSIGVNGAAVPDYLKCKYFTDDLRMLKPDMVVFGIGINDASGPNFDTVLFRQNYLRLVDSIRTVNPDCAFVFITNNDSYKRAKKRTYVVNTNGPKARDVFYRLAADTQGAVWDQFEIMGGLKSMEQWRLSKLAQYDRVHFTRAGYELVADLFSEALKEALSHHTPSES